MSNHLTSYVFPFHGFELDTQVAVSEVIARLQTITEPKWWRRPKDKKFIGNVSVDRFRILPIIRGRNTYLPWLLGSVAPSATGGARITAIMTLHPIAIMVMVALVGLAVQPSQAQGGWISIVMLSLFHLGMCAYGFVLEVKNIETILRKLVAAADPPRKHRQESSQRGRTSDDKHECLAGDSLPWLGHEREEIAGPWRVADSLTAQYAQRIGVMGENQHRKKGR
jgi:hypothetical protein